jgi:hypothetical protein
VVGESLDLGQVMGHPQHRHTASGDRACQVLQAQCGRLVQRGGGLVSHQHLRPHEQAASQTQELRLTPPTACLLPGQNRRRKPDIRQHIEMLLPIREASGGLSRTVPANTVGRWSTILTERRSASTSRSRRSRPTTGPHHESGQSGGCTVDLPDPDGPTTTVMPDPGTWRFSSLRTATSPRTTSTPLNVNSPSIHCRLATDRTAPRPTPIQRVSPGRGAGRQGRRASATTSPTARELR